MANATRNGRGASGNAPAKNNTRDMRGQNSGRTNQSRGNQNNQQPVSKSQMIRDLNDRGLETGEIIEELKTNGFERVHYSEVYGAIARGNEDNRHDNTRENGNHGSQGGRNNAEKEGGRSGGRRNP